MNFLRILTALTVILAAVPALAGGDPPTIYTLTVYRQATTRPVMKYSLMPSPLKPSEGNAAPLYLTAASLWDRAAENFNAPLTEEDCKRLGVAVGTYHTWEDAFLELPLAQLRSPDLDKFLASKAFAFESVEIASRREYCRWDLPFREQGFRTLLPHLNGLRGIALGICIQARAQLAAGDVPGAMRSLQINFAMVRALNQQSVLLQSLVGTAIAAKSLQIVREAEQLALAPNLFWALADLPRPLTNLRASLDMERITLYTTLPELMRAREGTFTDPDWRRLMLRMSSVGDMLGSKELTSMGQGLGMIAASAALFPQARQYLIDTGMPEAEVDALTKPVVLGRYVQQSYDEVSEKMNAWATLPYWQAHPGMLKAEEDLKKQKQGVVTNPLFMFVPAVSRAVFNVWRLERDIAAMQTVEALRDYAGRHSGSLPKLLEELAETPAPIDPTTGESFIYRVEGNTVRLESPAPAGQSAKDGLVVKVTFAK